MIYTNFQHVQVFAPVWKKRIGVNGQTQSRMLGVCQQTSGWKIFMGIAVQLVTFLLLLPLLLQLLLLPLPLVTFLLLK